MNRLLILLKERDTAFIQRFCNSDVYMDEHGQEIKGVCRHITAHEVLLFMHQYDAHIIQVLKHKYGLSIDGFEEGTEPELRS